MALPETVTAFAELLIVNVLGLISAVPVTVTGFTALVIPKVPTDTVHPSDSVTD